jgi:Ino eighty subunit 1
MPVAHNKRAASPSATPRKVVPIKHADGQPLTRVDIQFDFLNAVFADSHAVFTNPYAGDDTTTCPKVTFRELYVNSILHSPKATKVLKDKMAESAMFAVDFAMLALLVNVGRVNTTMSCERPCSSARP